MLKSRKRPKTLKANHPFIFCLREEANVYFMGRVIDLPKSLLSDTEALIADDDGPNWVDFL